MRYGLTKEFLEECLRCASDGEAVTIMTRNPAYVQDRLEEMCDDPEVLARIDIRTGG